MAKQTKNGISAKTVKTWTETETDSQRGSDGYPNVIKMRCKVCYEFRARLKNVRNFSTAFIDGISGASLKRDNVRNHSTSVMHLHAMRMHQQPTFSVVSSDTIVYLFTMA